ncbi:uncharacterized protein [Nicotiana tomentosiformis]|uniref:uncharacterized protein n=1 Tax=Nicotiana tomentosiformis TaxID=4098 RepID=UPI00388CE1C6
MADDEQRILERFERLRPSPFSGTESEDAQGFLDKCQRMLWTTGFPLVLDKAMVTKTRPTSTKHRIEIDLAKPILNEITVEIRNHEGNIEEFIQLANNNSTTNIDKGVEYGWHTLNKRKNINKDNNIHVVMTTQKGNDTANMINDGQSIVIVTHNNSGEVNMEVIPDVASLIPQAQAKHTIRDKYNSNKDNKKKSKLLTINKASKKTYQGNEAEYPEIELSSDFVDNQKDIMNTSLEPMLRARKIEKYKSMIGYQEYLHNCSNKIWVLWSTDYKINVLDDKEQQVLLQIFQIHGNISFHITIVYAKCDETQRTVLWDELRSTSNNINGHWRLVGDFNVAISSEKMLGGLPYRIQDGIDFLSCLNDCNLQDGGFHGTTKVTHLSRICFDHVPLLIECGNSDPTHTRYFKFLNIWVDHDEYLNVIQQSWVEEVHGNPLYILHQKTKRVCSTLRRWSKATFGDIYEEPKKLEKLIKELEEASITNNTQDIRTKMARTKAEFTSFLILEEMPTQLTSMESLRIE